MQGCYLILHGERRFRCPSRAGLSDQVCGIGITAVGLQTLPKKPKNFECEFLDDSTPGLLPLRS